MSVTSDGTMSVTSDGTTSIVCPVVHSNGDNAKTLIANLENVYDALQVTLEALKQGAPNGRNYYVVPGLYTEAVAQHTKRMQVLTDMQDELLIELEGINVQNHRWAREQS